MKIGEYNTLRVSRIVDFGLYLADADGAEVLLPARYITEVPEVDDEMRVFVYKDSENRPVATTEKPYATVGQVAFLQVSETDRVGAFLDWGLIAKDLLVPFREQRATMKRGGVYPVYVYLDHASGRVVASAKIEKFLGNTIPRYRRGDKVEALILQHVDELGYKVVVDNLFYGMIYDNRLYDPLVVGQSITAYVDKVRPDGKIDLTVSHGTRDDVARLATRILDYLRDPVAVKLDDTLPPETVKELFGCSKKLYKQALGMLYKDGRLTK